jgi:prepilin-type N-terminal cleavage/methylation domain-containing protein/prepilin-type processing-associated H-X9-DG protein
MQVSRWHMDDQQHCARTAGAGFTLVELLVVIAIIGVLAALLLPALAESKNRAQRVACLSQMRQIGLAWMLYLQDYHDRFPDRRDLKDSLVEGYRPWSSWPPSDPRAGWAPHVLHNQLPTNSIWQCPSLVRSPLYREIQSRQWPTADTNGPAVGYWMWRFDRTNAPVPLDNFWGKTVAATLLDLERADSPFLPGPHRTGHVELMVDVYYPRTASALPDELRGRAAHRGGLNRLFLDGRVVFQRDARLR